MLKSLWEFHTGNIWARRQGGKLPARALTVVKLLLGASGQKFLPSAFANSVFVGEALAWQFECAILAMLLHQVNGCQELGRPLVCLMAT